MKGEGMSRKFRERDRIFDIIWDAINDGSSVVVVDSLGVSHFLNPRPEVLSHDKYYTWIFYQGARENELRSISVSNIVYIKEVW